MFIPVEGTKTKRGGKEVSKVDLSQFRAAATAGGFVIIPDCRVFVHPFAAVLYPAIAAECDPVVVGGWVFEVVVQTCVMFDESHI